MATRRPLPKAPFDRFFNYDELTDYLHRLVAARPELCRLDALGESRQGRAIHMLTVTDAATGASHDKPAYLIHANIHASEVAGTQVSLHTARQLLADHRRNDLLQRVAFHIVPRLNPDNAEACVTANAAIRSRNQDEPREPNTLYQQDVDGNGLILRMRQPHPDGDHQLDPEDPRLLIPRRPHDAGPFYRVLPEGMIHDWDGSDAIKTHTRSFDWNRNWSYDWRPEPEQPGAGDFPFSEPEMRCIGQFLHERTNLFAVLGYHTGPAAVLRPPSTGSINDIDAGDEQSIEDIARMAAQATGLGIYPVIHYRNVRRRDNNLRGHFHNFGYQHLGLFAYEFELGTILDSAGMDARTVLGSETPREDRPAFLRRVLKWWDRQPRKTREPLFVDWKRFDHPQLGAVEIGGFLVCHHNNPTLRDLAKLSKGTYRFTVDHAQMHPRVVIEDVQVDAVAPHVQRVRARIANRGELPTHVTNRGRQLARLRPVRVSFEPGDGVTLLSQSGHHTLGHLDGITGSRTVEWFVNSADARGELATLRIDGGAGGNATHVIRPR